ncbi:unnamed protein product, partial [Rotaria socialis]
MGNAFRSTNYCSSMSYYSTNNIILQIFEHQQITCAEKIALCKWISQLCRQWQMPSGRQTIVHLCVSGSNYGCSYRNSSDTEPYL